MRGIRGVGSERGVIEVVRVGREGRKGKEKKRKDWVMNWDWNLTNDMILDGPLSMYYKLGNDDTKATKKTKQLTSISTSQKKHA